jgi:centrin-1
MRSAFELFDRDNSGNIDATELRDAMKALGIYLKRDAVKELMKTVDKDKSGSIEFEEFLTLMQDKISSRNPLDELKKAFRVYDEDDSGKISLDNLKKVSIEMDGEITDEELKEMIYEADGDGDGEVSLDEFLALMQRCKLF